MEKLAISQTKVINAIKARAKSLDQVPDNLYRTYSKDIRQINDVLNESMTKGFAKIRPAGFKRPTTSVQIHGEKLKELAADKVINKQHIGWESNFRPKTKKDLLNSLEQTYKHKHLTDSDFNHALKVKLNLI